MRCDRTTPARFCVALAAITCALSGCEPIAGPVEVMAVVWDDEAKQAVYGQTTIDNVTDLIRGDGASISIRRDVQFEASPALVSQEPSFAKTVENNRRFLTARPADLRLHEDKGVWVPDDFDSLAALTTWSSVEKTLLYLKAAGQTGPAVDSDLVVSVHGRITLLGMPPTGPDNAAYLPMLDMVQVGPPGAVGVFSDLVGGVPVSTGLSPGVVAHELGHRVFNYRFGEPTGSWNGVDDEFSKTMESGLNEGFADLLALAVMRTDDFMSFGFSDRRSLRGELGSTVTYDALVANSVEDCGEGLFGDEPGIDKYCIATLLAASVFEGAGYDVTTHREVVFPALLRALDGAAARINTRAEAEGLVTIGAADILAPLVEELDDPDLRASMCAAFTWRFASLVEGGLLCAD